MGFDWPIYRSPLARKFTMLGASWGLIHEHLIYFCAENRSTALESAIYGGLISTVFGAGALGYWLDVNSERNG